MTDEEMKKFLSDNSADIQRVVKERLIDRLVQTHHWPISEAINAAVAEFVAKEIAPVVRTQLEGEKGAILEATLIASRQIGEIITKKMVEQAAKNVEGYQFRKMMETVFG